ncbi:MAG: SpoIIE family protein phosphatase [Clostridium sp.]|nr:SpoIIE family protein phosphatase [Clostridium sp.]MCM1547052.1 SpoIIE family protein phosphatase [Ruminococcus sp.]
MLKETVLEKNRRSLNLPLMIIVLGISMLLAHSTIGGMPSPLNCALAAALPAVYSAAVVAGSMAVYLVTGNIAETGVIICGLLLTAVGKWIMREDDSPALSSITAAICTGFSGIVFGLIVKQDLTLTLVYVVLALAVGLLVYLLNNIGKTAFTETPLKLDGKFELSAAAIYMLAVTALCSAGISVLNIGRIIGAAAILCAAKRFKYSGGVVFGVLTTAGIFLSSAKLGVPAVFLGIAGFAAGFLSAHSRVSIAAAFLSVNFCGQLITGMGDDSFFLQADVIFGSIIFMLIPEKLLMYGQVIRSIPENSDDHFVKLRMDFVAETLADVRRNFEQIIKCLEKNKVPFNTVNEVSTRICGKCRNKVNCWETNFEKTNSCFLKLEKQNSPSIDTFPTGLDHCMRKYDIAECFARCRKEDAVNKMLSARLNENRSILFSQMETTEGILSSLSDKMNFSCSKEITRSLCVFLEKNNIDFTAAIAYFNANDRLTAEIYVRELPERQPEEIAEMLTAEFRTPMEFSEPVSCGNETRLRFSRKTRYNAEYSFDQKSAREGQPSGDSIGFFEDGLGYAYLFISDGMGSGKQAALDSAIVSGIFKRLIKSGIECGCAMKMLNSIMLTKSGDESFATLDVARIDLETCELSLFKSGAASTLIKYEGSVMMFNSPSNPIGIIADSQVFTRTCNFSEGDILVMLSDGIDESFYHFIKEQLMGKNELRDITENVCSGADKNSGRGMRDDITVAALKLVKR